ncbi:MAG: GNAT family N-acetyltransferase [Lachnospiraceae bacterium]
MFRCIAGEAELLRIGVRPPLRGLGYGKKLMDGVVENSSKKWGYAIALEVREGNTPARSLYKSYGFKEECRRAYYRDPKEDAVIMWNRDLRKHLPLKFRHGTVYNVGVSGVGAVSPVFAK